tara:strand:- start:722 stop:1024 length:303 start_codon:yes stop_codon:yes gene_type:complete
MDCDWCKESMKEDAIVCPSCKREKKDLHSLRIKMYTFISISSFATIYGFASGDWLTPLFGEFKASRFFSTVSGWLTIFSFVISQIYYVKASKIIKSWWWM